MAILAAKPENQLDFNAWADKIDKAAKAAAVGPYDDVEKVFLSLEKHPIILHAETFNKKSVDHFRNRLNEVKDVFRSILQRDHDLESGSGQGEN